MRGLEYQYFLGVDARGDVIAVTTDGPKNKVILFHARTGDFMRSFGVKGSEPGTLHQAISVRCVFHHERSVFVFCRECVLVCLMECTTIIRSLLQWLLRNFL